MWWGWRVPWWMSYFHLVAVYVINSCAHVWPLPTYQTHLCLLGYPGGNCPLQSGGRAKTERRVASTESLGGYRVEYTAGGNDVKIFRWARPKIVLLLPVQCYFRIGSIFWNNFLHKNIAQFDFSCSKFVDKDIFCLDLFFSTFFFYVFSRENLTKNNCVPWCKLLRGE